MDMAVSGDELRDAARLARESVVVGRAVSLARWIGMGRRPVTAGQVLRKADVPAAGAAVGVDVPPRLRTMAEFAAAGAPRSIDQVAELKVSLSGSSPPIWRRVTRDRDQDYPVCVAYKGDSPVEYWSEDDPEEPESFNLAEVNRKLAALGEAEE